MKKVIIASLLTSIILNNIAYANEVSSIDYQDNINEEILYDDKENIRSNNKVNVYDYDSLKVALAKSNVEVNVKNNIQVKDTINITGSNIRINGNGFKLDLNETDPKNKTNKFVIKASNVEIDNLIFENYISTAIYLYKANNIYIKNITLSGNNKNLSLDKQSLVGIDLDNSTAKLKNINSKNHRYSSIRLRKESSIELEGGNTYIDDNEEIQSVVLNGASDNNITDSCNQYTEIRESIDDNNTKNKYYNMRKIINVHSFESLKNALSIPNSIININNDIKFSEDLNIANKNLIINGNDKNFDLNNFKFVVKADDTTLKNIKIKDYISNGLSIYRASNVNISNVTLIGNNLSLDEKNRSKVGIDIYNSKVSIGNINTSNHLYKGIQVRCGSTVDILHNNYHSNDTINMQSIKEDGDIDNKINDINNYYITGTEKINDGKSTIDYFSKVPINISTSKDFISNLNNSGNVLYIDKDIKLESSDIPSDEDILELIVNSNITIEGNRHTIDLNNIGTITLSGNDTVLKDLNIKNSKDIGINIYNSRDVLLDNVDVTDSSRYGIFVNGSKVKLKNCYTSNNYEGGIMITRSRALSGSNYIDSHVEVIDSIRHDEANINVEVKNLEMVDGYFQNNEFIVPDNIYNQYDNDVEYKTLSDYYLNLFDLKEDRNKKYKEQSKDYMVIQKVINVKENNEVLDENGKPIRLIGDGIVDETDNIERFIEYAASHGIELYFPKGTYKITRDIDLSKINLPALSNFTIAGDKDGLAIIDASSTYDRMLKIKDEEYKSQINYMNINNIVFNNVGVEFNGPYKKGISLDNNVFVNGKYTSELDSLGNIKKVTMEPYILVKNNKYTIENNIFLRSKNYPGRGISTYKTKNTTIKNNYFGDLEGINDASNMLPSDVINKLNAVKNSLNDLGLEGTQGNFFTAINNERYDENIEIYNNYFNIEKTRYISSNFGQDVLISGINVSKYGQIRDHIIYSKSYNGLNIYGNYFKGMENSASGGVKIRNGNNAYIGSNYFDDVPLLTYIYSDLTKSESLLYGTTIYNNLFHCKTNFGEEGTGILYYQSFRDGEDLEFKETNFNGNVTTNEWDNAFGDVKNFVIYKNQFFSDDRDQITISVRAKKAYNDNEFLAYGNEYLDNSETVNYNKGNLTLSQANESDVISNLNDGYKKYKNVDIPLTPISVDYTYINQIIEEANSFYNDIKNKGLIGSLYCEKLANELKSLIDETVSMIKSKSLNQYDTNRRITLIEEILNKLKECISSENNNTTIEINNAPIIQASDKTLKAGEKFTPLEGVTAYDYEDGDITNKVKIVANNTDINKNGEYEVKYEVTDSENVITSKTISVVVISDSKPIITGVEDIKITNLSNFNPMEDVTAYDNEDGDITQKIIILGSTNINDSRKYNLIYRASDRESNITEFINKVLAYDNKFNLVENIKAGEETKILIWIITGSIALVGIIFLNRKKK